MRLICSGTIDLQQKLEAIETQKENLSRESDQEILQNEQSELTRISQTTPSRAGQESVIVFGKSSWSPSSFFSLIDSDPRLNGWVRIQTDEKLRDHDTFKVLLYKVDYHNWKVEKILEAPQISPVGIAGDLAYLEKVGDLGRLNHETEVIYGNSYRVPAHGLVDYDLCSQDKENVYGVVTVQAQTANTIAATVLRIGENEQYRFPTPVRQ